MVFDFKCAKRCTLCRLPRQFLTGFVLTDKDLADVHNLLVRQVEGAGQPIIDDGTPNCENSLFDQEGKFLADYGQRIC
jgi:hypothetical protein